MSASMLDWERVNSTGTAGAAFADRNATTTKPVNATGIAVIDLKARFDQGLAVPNFVELMPIVADTDGDTASFRVWAWNKLILSGVTHWVPRLLVHFVATATDQAVPSTIDAAAGAFFCDTIAVSYGDANAQVISPGNDALASILLHIRGAELIQFDWTNVSAGTPTANLLWRMISQG